MVWICLPVKRMTSACTTGSAGLWCSGHTGVEHIHVYVRATSEWAMIWKSDTLFAPQGPESLLCDFKVVWPSEVIQPPWVLALQPEECLPQNRDDEIISLYSYVFMGVAHMCYDACVKVIEHLLGVRSPLPPHGFQGWNWRSQAWLKHLYQSVRLVLLLTWDVLSTVRWNVTSSC